MSELGTGGEDSQRVNRVSRVPFCTFVPKTASLLKSVDPPVKTQLCRRSSESIAIPELRRHYQSENPRIRAAGSLGGGDHLEKRVIQQRRMLPQGIAPQAAAYTSLGSYLFGTRTTRMTLGGCYTTYRLQHVQKMSAGKISPKNL